MSGLRGFILRGMRGMAGDFDTWRAVTVIDTFTFSDAIAPRRPPLPPPAANVQSERGYRFGCESKGERVIASELRFVKTTARGSPVGESHGRCRFSDEVVLRARQMRAAGMHYRAIATAAGASLSTVYGWVNGDRPAPARIIAKRSKTPRVGRGLTASSGFASGGTTETLDRDSTRDSEKAEKDGL